MKTNKATEMLNVYKQNYIFSPEQIEKIHEKYIQELNRIFALQKKEPEKFIEDLLRFMIEQDFDSNFIRAIFKQESKSGNLERKELDVFKNVWLNDMLIIRDPK